MKQINLALRMFRRNAKSTEARVLLFALLIAVMSVTTVSFFADRVESALNRQANELIAADGVVISDKPIAAKFRDEAIRLNLTTAEEVRRYGLTRSTLSTTLATMKRIWRSQVVGSKCSSLASSDNNTMP